jgi:hypothetical protein
MQAVVQQGRRLPLGEGLPGVGGEFRVSSHAALIIHLINLQGESTGAEQAQQAWQALSRIA